VEFLDVPKVKVCCSGGSDCSDCLDEVGTLAYVRYVILTCHSYVTVYIYPRYSHLKSLASDFGLQVRRTHPHVYLIFLLRTSAIQSLTQTGYGPQPLDCAPTTVFIVLSSSAGILNAILGAPPRNTYPSHPARLHRDWVAGTLVTFTFSFHLNWQHVQWSRTAWLNPESEIMVCGLTTHCSEADFTLHLPRPASFLILY